MSLSMDCYSDSFSRLATTNLKQNNSTSLEGKIVTDHLFVNNVRFLSMAAVIGLHTISGYGTVLNRNSMPQIFYYLIGPLKFGTIGFFLAAGFLFGERVDQTSPLRYFLRRLRNVFLPWCVWLSLWCSRRFFIDLSQGRQIDLPYVIDLYKVRALASAYWFVPNLIIALAILLICRRFLHDVRIGLVFLAATFFYSANIYGHWIAVVHSKAVFGFIFYLWLGAWSAWHFPDVERFIAKISAPIMIGLTLTALGFAIAESRLLMALGSVDPVNTLRLSNQIYSLMFVLAILKLKHAMWPRFVDVRKHTYGLYLLHTIVLGFFCLKLQPILLPLGAAPWWIIGTVTLLLIPALFASVYGISLLLVRILLRFPMLRWMVGIQTRKQPIKAERSPQFALVTVPRQP